MVLNLDEELKKGKRTVDLATLFPTSFAFEQFKGRYVAGNRKAIVQDSKISDRYLGNYQYESGRQIKIVKENRLFYISDNQNKYEILPLSENRFFFKDMDIQLTFVNDSSGRSTELILHFDGDRKAKRID